MSDCLALLYFFAEIVKHLKRFACIFSNVAHRSFDGSMERLNPGGATLVGSPGVAEALFGGSWEILG